jgi:hypothetical protein
VSTAIRNPFVGTWVYCGHAPGGISPAGVVASFDAVRQH